eukprot:CAMPEP_0182848584 /NCGR_PEP_ID=MMETSP0006_2-20121128/29080_1 /TAXON_ID=97485 /ORGANISM="Prymnesium parvum, Strain Texoma1" /LENGTH=99 /DNA_ID=CAMNT_0024979015 /DNA_START=850 /DNA_END=1149 /DNA_ORIENTATION=+
MGARPDQRLGDAGFEVILAELGDPLRAASASSRMRIADSTAVGSLTGVTPNIPMRSTTATNVSGRIPDAPDVGTRSLLNLEELPRASTTSSASSPATSS